MDKCMALLGINISSKSMSYAARNFVDEKTIEVFNRNNKELKKIGDSFSGVIEPSSYDLKKIYKRFMRFAPMGRMLLEREFFNYKDVVQLSFCLGYGEQDERIIDSKYLETALFLLEKYWRNRMFIPIIQYLLRNWISILPENHSLLTSFLSRMINHYDGRHPYYLLLKTNKEFFSSSNGPFNMASNMLQKNISLLSLKDDFPLLKEFQGNEYIGEVLYEFLKVVLSKGTYPYYLDGILVVLNELNLSYISCRCLVPIIIEVNQEPTPSIKKIVKDAAFNLVGDPATDFKWHLWPRVSLSEKEQVNKARQILNTWLAQDYVPFFFQNIRMNKDREEFWLPYIEHIDYFSIFCGSEYYYNLRIGERLGEEAITRIRRLKGTANLCALVMCMKDKVLIEFSKKGNAFYAYDNHSSYCPDVMREKELSVSDLKKTNFVDVLSYDNYMVPEIRLLHTDRSVWQSKLSRWLSYHITGSE